VDILSQSNIPHYINWHKMGNAKWADRWDLTISGFNRMKRFLPWITPYLFTKRKQAELISEFMDLRKDELTRVYGEDEIKIVKYVQELNRKGPRDYTLSR
jgi:hypothetical protein